MDDRVSSDERERALSFLTAEHAGLQSARLNTVIDSNGRLADFVGAVSAAVIALAFIGQTSEFGVSFFLFALTLLPTLAVLGVFTFARALQCRIEDAYYALAINRIRHYYLEAAPHARPYVLMPDHDDVNDALRVGVHSSSMTPMMTVAGSVAFVNSILVGATASLGLSIAFATSIFMSTGAGGVCFALSLAIHHLYQRRRWHATYASYESRFPLTRQSSSK